MKKKPNYELMAASLADRVHILASDADFGTSSIERERLFREMGRFCRDEAKSIKEDRAKAKALEHKELTQ